MRVSETVILSALRRGGCIKSFYRMSARRAALSPQRLPDGYVLETPGEPGESLLSHTDFQMVERWLEQTATWEQTVGNACFGGATWQLRPEHDACLPE